MRVFAVSDIHVDYGLNWRWICGLSNLDYRDDVLIVAGDVSDSLTRLAVTLETLAGKFRHLLYVPGNHELWVVRDPVHWTSLEKFDQVCEVARCSGASMEVFRHKDLAIVPLLGWYDFSFGVPSSDLRAAWMDFHACRWPEKFDMADVARHFESLNQIELREADRVITFSHFLPRIDILPTWTPLQKRFLDPVLGATRLETQVRALNSRLHVYGHSHMNHCVLIHGVSYVNCALGYPHEHQLSSRQLRCIHSTDGDHTCGTDGMESLERCACRT
jgi:hypothetical protein